MVYSKQNKNDNQMKQKQNDHKYRNIHNDQNKLNKSVSNNKPKSNKNCIKNKKNNKNKRCKKRKRDQIETNSNLSAESYPAHPPRKKKRSLNMDDNDMMYNKTNNSSKPKRLSCSQQVFMSKKNQTVYITKNILQNQIRNDQDTKAMHQMCQYYYHSKLLHKKNYLHLFHKPQHHLLQQINQ